MGEGRTINCRTEAIVFGKRLLEEKGRYVVAFDSKKLYVRWDSEKRRECWDSITRRTR